MTFNADINPKPNWWHVVASNGATVPNSNNIEYKFLLYDGFEIDTTTSKQIATRGQNLFTSGPKIPYGTNITFFVLNDENGSKMGMNGYISEFQSNGKSQTKHSTKVVAQDTCTQIAAPPATFAVPKATSTTTVLATILTTVTQSTTTSSTVLSTVVQPTTIETTVTTTTTSPKIVFISASPSLKAYKNYSENDKISIPCSGDFTLSVTSNSIDSDLFFGFVDAIGVAKNGKYIELQVGLKNGQNSVKDLVAAQIRRRLFKRGKIAK
ncbi:hypothetical protein BB560_004296, partial [Smittium megazygosporum]